MVFDITIFILYFSVFNIKNKDETSILEFNSQQFLFHRIRKNLIHLERIIAITAIYPFACCLLGAGVNNPLFWVYFKIGDIRHISKRILQFFDFRKLGSPMFIIEDVDLLIPILATVHTISVNKRSLIRFSL